MLHVVSGWQRTGSSMMMKALEAGGMDAGYRKERDELVQKWGDEDYSPNEGGLYELDKQDYQKANFPRDYDGKLVKALAKGVLNMRTMQDGIRVVYMRRHPEEIRQSFDGFFGNGGFKRLFNTSNEQALKKSWDNFNENIEIIIEGIRNRRDILSCTEVWFKDVISDPEREFTRIKKDGWDINVADAASIVKPELYRFRLDRLEVGI